MILVHHSSATVIYNVVVPANVHIFAKKEKERERKSKKEKEREIKRKKERKRKEEKETEYLSVGKTQ